MFSKALFKQSCKANGTMWGVITFAVCFMLACVMLISGNGNIGMVRNSIEDTIIIKETDAQLEEKAISYYANAEEGLAEFDGLFSANAADTLSYLTWCSQMPSSADFADIESYAAATDIWTNAAPTMQTQAGKAFSDSLNEWLDNAPKSEDFASQESYSAAAQSWLELAPTQQDAVATAYSYACDELSDYLANCASKVGYAEDSTQANEILGTVMYTLNPNGTFDDFYEKNGEQPLDEYDYISLITHIADGDIETYLNGSERDSYRQSRAADGASIFLAANVTDEEVIEAMLEALDDYGVTREKYDSFGYTYDHVKHMANTAVVTYQGRLEYELSLIDEQYKTDDLENNEEYINAMTEKKAELKSDISASFLSTLPSEVSEALDEIGQADLYTLIVGSIFYKLAGLLLPIIYMIMASNNLIAGQVDSGSMAYVLSTSTKRSTVVFTQAIYLLGSLFAMFSLTTITGCICLRLVTQEVELTYTKLILLNVGAFLVLVALSGLCFFTSCVFDRSKRSMAIGGGLSIFALVAAMLGLFGSPVIPSVVRLEALNNFNFATIISLFDVISIIDGTNTFIIKFIILGISGIIGYIAGSLCFVKKDLPL